MDFLILRRAVATVGIAKVSPRSIDFMGEAYQHQLKDATQGTRPEWIAAVAAETAMTLNRIEAHVAMGSWTPVSNLPAGARKAKWERSLYLFRWGRLPRPGRPGPRRQQAWRKSARPDLLGWRWTAWQAVPTGTVTGS